MFYGGLPGVLILVVNPDRKHYYFNIGVGDGFLTDLQKVIGVGPGIAVQLDLWMVMGGDAINVRVSEDQDWFSRFKKPVLNLPIGACNMVCGSEMGLSLCCSGWSCRRERRRGSGGGSRFLAGRLWVTSLNYWKRWCVVVSGWCWETF